MLENIVIDTQKVRTTAAEKHAGVGDICTLIETNLDSEGRLYNVLEGVYHEDRGEAYADICEEDEWLYLGLENTAAKAHTVIKWLDETRKKDLSEKGLGAIK